MKGSAARQKHGAKTHPLLERLGERVRAARHERGLSLRALAAQCGLSERFISDLESGRGNISVLNLAGVAEALGVPLTSLLSDTALPKAAEPRTVIALLGLRGAGKSSVGKALAEALSVPFFELDRQVEAEAGMGLSELFAIHGEAYYRQVELSALKRLLAQHKRAVIATGGGVVTSAEAFALLLEKTRTVWLKAAPEEHWDRVVRQGDLRPIRNRPQAMSELKRRLKEREPLYARADLTLSTTDKPLLDVVKELAERLR